MPWETTSQFIQSGHRSPEEVQQDTLKTIKLNDEEGIQAVIGKTKAKAAMEVQSYLFDQSKGWTLQKAQAWFKRHQQNGAESVVAVLPFEIKERIAENPLRIRGVALTAGISRNMNIYTAEELAAFADKLVDSPMYIEHVAVPNAIGRVANARWDGQQLLYEAEVFDEEIAAKIRAGLIKHVSVGADYETIDFLSGKVPHGLHNAEISLVAVPGIPEANIQIMEKLHLQNAVEPIVAGEYSLGFVQDAAAFLPEHFSMVWLDRESGVLAICGRLRSQPEATRTWAILFGKEKMWSQIKIQDWLRLHPDYMTPAAASVSGVESLLWKPSEPTIPVGEAVKVIEAVLPSPLVQRSWSLGPQRMCQELRRAILQLKSRNHSHSVTASS
ncbi:MAG: hypothetical protein NWF05_08505 [Candidatus Bathyarchaeota archaeon]|nr:hypothetical protein [Candidatus Bathyarchaeota archaeon]